MNTIYTLSPENCSINISRMEFFKSIDKPRIVALDSLRGLAAVTVVVAHSCGLLINGHTIDEYTPLYLFRAAHESVIFFFVLSGYVLTYQVRARHYFIYKSFLAQRILRIYIPYLVVMVLVFAMYIALSKNRYSLTPSGLPQWQKDALDSLLLIGNFNTNTYNNVIWSLVHEIRVAIIFPFLLYIISLSPIRIISALIITSLLVGLAVAFGLDNSIGYKNSYLYTVHYFSFFVLGAMLVKYSEEISKWYTYLKFRRKRIFLLLALLVFCYSRMLYLIPHKFGYLRISLFNEFIADWITSFAAAFFVIYATHIASHSHILLHPTLVFLGKISYSLYLVHLPVLTMGLLLFASNNKVVVVTGSILIGFILSLVLYKGVEKPSAKLWRHFSL